MGESRREVIDPLELYRSKPAAEDFRATIISETTGAARRAQLFHDQLAATRSGKEGTLSLSRWNFSSLTERQARNDAASAAASANVVILSMSGMHPLPAQAQRWIEMWLWLLDDRRPALVALFSAAHTKSGCIEKLLRKAAADKRLVFFSLYSEGESAGTQPAQRHANETNGTSLAEAPAISPLTGSMRCHQRARSRRVQGGWLPPRVAGAATIASVTG
jgi:hypothetical protein